MNNRVAKKTRVICNADANSCFSLIYIFTYLAKTYTLAHAKQWSSHFSRSASSEFQPAPCGEFNESKEIQKWPKYLSNPW